MQTATPPVVDTHNHYWVVGESELAWMDGLPVDSVLRDSFGPPDLKPHMDASGVDLSLIVQASHAWSDQLWYCELAERYDYVSGVIAWVDLAASDVGDKLDALAQNRSYRGVRAGAEDQPDPDWLARADVRRGIEAVTSRGQVLELLVQTPHLRHVPAIARENDGARLIVDHMAKPPFASGDLSEWTRCMREVAAIDHVRMKISGLLTECPSAPTTETIRPAVSMILDSFSIDRLMWGSDWPVSLQAASYTETFARVTAALDGLSASERAAVLGANAVEFYSLA